MYMFYEGDHWSFTTYETMMQVEIYEIFFFKLIVLYKMVNINEFHCTKLKINNVCFYFISMVG